MGQALKRLPGAHAAQFRDFLDSLDTLRVYRRGHLVFASQKERLAPLLEYLAAFPEAPGGAVIFDKVLGNAAALLLVKAGCRLALSPLGSELARITLERYGVRYYFSDVVARIVTPEGRLCPMEELSTGKDPDQFYAAVRQAVKPEEC